MVEGAGGESALQQSIPHRRSPNRDRVKDVGSPKRQKSFYWFAKSAVTKYRNLGGLKSEIYHLTVWNLDAQNQCHWGWSLQRAVRASLLASGGRLRHSLAGWQHSLYVFTWPSVCIQISPFYKATSHTGSGLSSWPHF
jgi:hypothetical protein